MKVVVFYEFLMICLVFIFCFRFAGQFSELNLSDVIICSTIGMCDTDPYTTHDLKHLPGGYRSLSPCMQFMDVDFNNPQVKKFIFVKSYLKMIIMK